MLFRVTHNKNFTVVNNFIIKDKRLSWKAKGIWLYAFSRPDDWTFRLNDLIKQSTDKKHSVNEGIKELQNCGYLIRIQGRDKGKYSESEWTFFEIPFEIPQELKEFLPKPENPSTVFPTTENQPLSNTELPIPDYLSNTEQQQIPVSCYPCLFAVVGVSDKEKEWITKTYDEETVKHAISYTFHPETKIDTDATRTLKWACKRKPELPKPKIKTLGRRELFEQTYKHNGMYNGADCFINEEGFAFERGRTHYELKWNAFDYDDKLKMILEFVNKRS